MLQETLNLFPNEQVLEAVCQWSNSLKLLQQRLGKYYKRSETRQAAFEYVQLYLFYVFNSKDFQKPLVISFVLMTRKVKAGSLDAFKVGLGLSFASV